MLIIFYCALKVRVLAAATRPTGRRPQTQRARYIAPIHRRALAQWVLDGAGFALVIRNCRSRNKLNSRRESQSGISICTPIYDDQHARRV